MASSGATPGWADSYVTDPQAKGAGAGGWHLFASLMFYFAGVWMVFEGMFALVGSSYFAGLPVFASLRFWAVVWMAFGVLLILAGSAVASRRTWARWFGIAVVVLSAVQTMLTVETATWWSAVVLTLDLLIFYGLTVRWRRPDSQEREAGGS
jgi:dipeptide/tripeptide permease